MSEPIFDELMAEFVKRSKYCRLRVGPPAGPGFEIVNGIKVGFEIVNGITRMIEMGPLVGEGFEVIDGITKLIVPEETSKPKLYIVEGAPELINLADVPEESEMEKTILIPKFKSDVPEPPSMSMLANTQYIPIVRDDEAYVPEAAERPVEVLADERDHVLPIKRVKAIHKKIGATGTLSWFTRAA